MLCEDITVKTTVRMMKIRTFSEIQHFNSFEERFEYLKLSGKVGRETFGFDRYLNQMLYKSERWKRLRNDIIVRDGACDLGVEDYDIYDRIIIHHMNPISVDDILNESEFVFSPEFLICTSLRTHNAIHYGDINLVTERFVERRKNDTCPWK